MAEYFPVHDIMFGGTAHISSIMLCYQLVWYGYKMKIYIALISQRPSNNGRWYVDRHTYAERRIQETDLSTSMDGGNKSTAGRPASKDLSLISAHRNYLSLVAKHV